MSVRIREATFDDWEVVRDVGVRNGFRPVVVGDGGRATPAAEAAAFSRPWREHPQASSFAGVPIGWILEDGAGRGVGTFMNHWAAYRLRGALVRAAVASAWAVDPSHRGAPALGLLSAFLRQKKVDLLVNTSPSPEAGPAFQAFKAKRVPLPGLDLCATWVLRHGAFLRSLSLHRRRPLPRALCRALGGPLDPAARVARRLLGGRWRDRVARAGSFDARFDRFWADLLAAHPERLLAQRDAATLTWHFGHRLDADTARILTLRSGGRMIGYAILLLEESPRLELRRARIADLQCLDPGAAGVAALVAACWAAAAADGAAVLELLGLAPEKRRAIARLLPLRRRVPTWPYLYKPCTDELARELESPRAWDPSDYDGDSSL
jgi:hypothetical protein